MSLDHEARVHQRTMTSNFRPVQVDIPNDMMLFLYENYRQSTQLEFRATSYVTTDPDLCVAALTSNSGYLDCRKYLMIRILHGSVPLRLEAK